MITARFAHCNSAELSKKFDKGATIVEIIVVILIIALFSAIVVADFPKISRQSALSRAAYQLSQDLRKTQDMGFSGVKVADINGQPIRAKGYGVYVNFALSTKQYVIYADLDSDQRYNGNLSYPLCNKQTGPSSDCVIEIIDVSQQNPSLYIKQINNISGNFTSINFSPPNPITKIDNLSLGNSEIGIVLGLNSDSSATRTVWANTSGLINVQ